MQTPAQGQSEAQVGTRVPGIRAPVRARPSTGTFVISVLILVLGFYVLYPVLLILINSFNIAGIAQDPHWSLDNWRIAFSKPEIWESLGNTFLVYVSYTVVSFPLAILIAWALARTRMPFTHGLEFMFWVSYMLPSIAVTIGWTFLLDPNFGVLNTAIEFLPFVTDSPFNIYSVPGIVWAHLMANTISLKVMLLTPAFRNMNVLLEEAARVSGASNIRTMMRVTLPVMVPAITIVFMLNLVHIFSSFETEQILGTPIGFYIYTTRIFEWIRRFDPPLYGPATALASLTLILIAIIIPLSRWLLSRRQYTTVTGQFRPGLIDLGRFQPVAFAGIVTVLAFLTAVPIAALILGSFMNRVGFFEATPLFTLRHWSTVLADRFFLQALRTTLTLALSTAIISPLLFSVVAYVLVRTRLRGRVILDSILWMSASIPGLLSSLGLLWVFLRTPGLIWIYGTIWALLLVVILQGKLTSTQLLKGVFLQVGNDMEEAARVAGAGWFRTYFRIWLPIITPTLMLIGVLNFTIASSTTASIILLASRDTTTLSILALNKITPSASTSVEQAGIISLFIIGMTVVVAMVARRFGLRQGVSHDIRADARSKAERSAAAGGAQNAPTG